MNMMMKNMKEEAVVIRHNNSKKANEKVAKNFSGIFFCQKTNSGKYLPCKNAFFLYP
jgi:hypothetical protein